MIVGRLIGWIFILMALIVLGLDILAWANGAPLTMTQAGQLWFNIDRGSIGVTQAAIQRYVSPQLWDPVIVTILLWPAALIFGVLGILFLMLFRRRRAHTRFVG
jgi:hypothetical protein